MALRRVGYTAVWPATTGGHFANELADTMEQLGAFTPDTVSPLLAPIQVVVDTPDVASPLVEVFVSLDLFSNAGGNSQHGFIGLFRDGALVDGSRQRVTSGGPNNKRRQTYSHVVEDLPAGEQVTLVVMWEGSDTDDVRSNQANDGVTRVIVEAIDVSVPGDPVTRFVGPIIEGILV